MKTTGGMSRAKGAEDKALRVPAWTSPGLSAAAALHLGCLSGQLPVVKAKQFHTTSLRNRVPASKGSVL